MKDFFEDQLTTLRDSDIKNKKLLERMFLNPYNPILCNDFSDIAEISAIEKERKIAEITGKPIPLKSKKRKKITSKYNTNRLKIWREQVLTRDNHTCVKCGDKENLQAHHIKHKSKFPELQYKIDNGETLCKSCHKKQHPELKGNLFK